MSRVSRRAAMHAVSLCAVCASLAACAQDASSDAGVVRPRLRMGAVHQGDVLAGGRVTALVRVAQRGRIRLSVDLVPAGGRRVTVGRPRTVTVAPSGWRPVQVLLTRRGRAAIDRCGAARLVATLDMPFTPSRTVSRTLLLDPPGCGRFFSARAFWNTPLGRDTPVDGDSAAVVKELLRRVQPHRGSSLPPNINTDAYTPPLYTVAHDQPRVRVRLDRPPGYATQLEAAFRSVPLPRSARPASGGDRELVVWQPSTDTTWEFWQLRHASDGWHASWGGRLRNVMAGSGTYPDPRLSWGTSASGLPLVGGLILPRQLAAHRIDHALAVGVPGVRAGFFARPAQRTDGSSSCAHAPAEGARFRLDPALDVASLHLPPAVATLARAAQRYGLVVREQSGAVSFYAQNAATFPRSPYPALFGGRTAQQVAAAFPWSRLQLLRMDLVKFGNPKPGLPDLGGILGRCG